MALNTCPNVLVKWGLLTDALFSIFHEGHLWYIMLQTLCHITVHFDVAFLKSLKRLF